jgi:hypothetical protein
MADALTSVLETTTAERPATGFVFTEGPCTLFFTARTSVYTLRVKVPGQPHPWYRRRAR